MKTFDVQSIEINAPLERAFGYLADPHNLPSWTAAFKRVRDGRALMVTGAGQVEIELEVDASRAQGTVDWIMTFPDASIARAYSRLVNNDGKCIYSFVLTAPPVPLEQLEGALEQQSRTLHEELGVLRKKLEG
jgi:hypothetical protein